MNAEGVRFGAAPPAVVVMGPGQRLRRFRDDRGSGNGVSYWVYILASRRHGTLYVGVTNDVARRVAEHRDGEATGFTRRYGVTRLVWVQGFGEVSLAIGFERRLKRWRREWKVRLIEADNPNWDDLYLQMMSVGGQVRPVPLPDWEPTQRVSSRFSRQRKTGTHER